MLLIKKRRLPFRRFRQMLCIKISCWQLNEKKGIFGGKIFIRKKNVEYAFWTIIVPFFG